MRVGDRTRVVAIWSEFWGMAGVVTQVEPWVMVLIDGDSYPIKFDPAALAVEVAE
ncbi:MAG TPA: hypothetical protein VNJ04_04945 [Gemmatimonadaceae bacterium]|nr:hypothetical protein [Gemmatimonadaceae bacterium]